MELRAIMAGIAEQPLMHVLQALRNLQHADDFYPKLNYRRLLDNLLAQDYLQLRGWAKFARNTLPATEQQREPQREQQPPELEPSDAQGLLGMRQHQERTRGKLRRKTQMLRAQQLKLAEQRRDSGESLTLDLPLLMPRTSQASHTSSNTSTTGAAATKTTAKTTTTTTTTPQLNDGFEILRRTNLLELLLDHMLAMLAKATEFRNAQHAQLYLEQAQRLCRLYQQLGCSQYAQHYTDALCQAASSIERATTSASTSRGSPSASCSSSPMRRKSLKFVEHVVQMHSGELLPLKPPSPPGTPRAPPSAPPKSNEHDDDIILEARQPEPQLEPAPEPEPEPELEAAVPASSIESSMLGPLLQRLKVDPGALQAISTKTEQLMQTLAPEAKRDELRDMLKRNTQKLKSAFN